MVGYETFGKRGEREREKWIPRNPHLPSRRVRFPFNLSLSPFPRTLHRSVIHLCLVPPSPPPQNKTGPLARSSSDRSESDRTPTKNTSRAFRDTRTRVKVGKVSSISFQQKETSLRLEWFRSYVSIPVRTFAHEGDLLERKRRDVQGRVDVWWIVKEKGEANGHAHLDGTLVQLLLMG